MTDNATPNLPPDPAAEEATAEVEGYGLLDLGGAISPTSPAIVPDAAKSKGKVSVSEFQISKKTDVASAG